ncbi:hypothetical protein [Micromonospora sp. 4G55]|uniref:hypothetical protein n=1 Tax=Micromonospora sp. 4G55 TaxID=2806102 RepID=UPI001EE3D7D2|nr:hypothetical protein [Micromonospora sp. 4G55]
MAQRLGELSEQVDGVLPPLLARYARATVAGDDTELLAVADGFAALDLPVWAAEATATALRELRRERAVSAGAAHQRLAALARRATRSTHRRWRRCDRHCPTGNGRSPRWPPPG